MAVTSPYFTRPEYSQSDRQSSDSEMSTNNSNASSPKSNQKKKPFQHVKFILQGKLGPDVSKFVKSVRQTLAEPVDFEERLFENHISNIQITQKDIQVVDRTMVNNEISVKNAVTEFETGLLSNQTTEDFQINKGLLSLPNAFSMAFSSPTMVSTPVIPRGTYMEPSLAQIRASVLGTEQRLKMEDSIMNFGNETRDSNVSVKEEISDSLEENDAVNGGWYAQAMKSYMDTASRLDSTEYSTCAIKGGRSDPDNPFAITSPSFSDSAGKAVLTTLQSSNATIVMISVMSIGSREQLIPKIVNSKAAEGGIISIANPTASRGSKMTQTGNSNSMLESQTTSIMSKLQRSRTSSESTEDANADTKIDRLDINIRIEDDQYVGSGDNKRWQCKMCEKSYTTKHNLVTHILDHSGIKPHLCLVCGKYFKQLSHLNVHMLTHDNVRPHVCPVCNKGFTQISHLKRHEAVHTGSKPYTCDVCSRGFAFPSELRAHKEKHVANTEKCGDCNAEFPTSEDLQNHIAKKSHSQDLTCKYCDRVFRFPSLLRDHMATHEGIRPYICTECGMDFLKEHHLKSHLFTHTGVRPYSCPECGRSFNQKANMHRHMLIHNSERSYKCEVCGKTFTQQQTLKAHMVVHSSNKPYKCNICFKEFGRMHNLQGHMHVHNNSRPFKCSICQSSFTLKGNLNRHKKVKHGLDETTENMEVDAVKFLSTMSGRARQASSDYENDNDTDDGGSSRSSKKGRKSVPKKLLSKNVNDEKSETELESDLENVITYSDEEREIERLTGLQQETDGGADVELTEGGAEDSVQDKPDNSLQSFTAVGQRSSKRRKRKVIREDFTGALDDSDDEHITRQPSKRKKQSAKLDNIIATKFQS